MFEFEYVSPESLGIPSESILAFIEKAKDHSNELHSLQVLRHRKRCFFGSFAPYSRESDQIMFSFSKSLTSIAIGFAEQEGLLSLDEKLIDIFPDKCPEQISENLREADVFSLLTMTCGHADEIRPEKDEQDWIRTFLGHTFAYRPGTTFQYNTAGTNMLCAILRKRSGQNVTEYLKPRLFDVIGIPPVECGKLSDGTEMGGSGMYLTPESMARFAQFVLNRGRWEGKQLLSADWIDRASARQVDTMSEVYHTTAREWMQGFGFHFWKCSVKGSFRAAGAYGQYAVFFPEQDAAVVLTSVCSDTNRLLTDLIETVVASMKDHPIQEDPAVLTALRKTESSLEIPALWGIRNHDGEEKLKGLIFRAEESLPALAEIAGGAGRGFTDPGNLQSLSFSFTENSVIVRICQDNISYDAEASFTGHWSVKKICGREYGFAARWAACDTLVIDTRCTRAATGSRLHFRFTDEGLSLTVHSSYPAPWKLSDSAAEKEIRFSLCSVPKHT